MGKNQKMTKTIKYRLTGFIAGLLLIASLSACAPVSIPNPDVLSVMVSVVPQRYFVERIGAGHVNVEVMVAAGASPATYEPKPEQLKILSHAQVYFSIGVPFETIWLDKIIESSPDIRMVDTIAEIERLPIKAHYHDEDEHEGEDDDHAEGALDPHVWLSPALVKVQAKAIYDALVDLDPTHEPSYTANYEAFLQELDALESDIATTMAPFAGEKFMVFHPSWGYFAHDFGLEQIAVEVGGQEPSAQELAILIEEAKHEGIHVVFAQPEFSTADAETIAKEIDGEVLLISPLAMDWEDNLRSIAETFAETLGE